MAMFDSLAAELRGVIRTPWTDRDAFVVPDESSITFGHDGAKLNGAVLYADLEDSTALVNQYTPEFSATAFKTFLLCCARLIRFFDGEITAYDGDRVMAVFTGERKCSRAVRTALSINSAMFHVVNPAIASRYSGLAPGFYLGHGTGVDVSDLFVIKTGIRRNGDLAWIGRAANLAAKLSSVRLNDFRTWISEDVFRLMADDAKQYQGQSMWTYHTWQDRNVYGSNWWLMPHA